MFLENSVWKCPAVTHAVLRGEAVWERCLIGPYHRLKEQRSKQSFAAPFNQSAVVLREEVSPPISRLL